jgi:hypothetical protein
MIVLLSTAARPSRLAGLLATLCLLASTAGAATLNIPQTHPRLWFGDPARLAAARTYYATHPVTVNNALTGDNARHRALRALMSGNAAECAAAVSWAMRYDFEAADANGDGTADPGACNLASEGRYCDRARWEGEQAIMTYDWCHASFSASQRTTFIERWNRYVGALNEGPYNWAQMPANNYSWGYLRNSLLWGIASFGENPRAQEFIDHALDARYSATFVPWSNTFGVGGVSGEGSQYGAYPIEYSTVALWSARDFGFDAYQATPHWDHVSYYLAYATSPAPTAGASGATYELFPFNDDHNFLAGGSAEKSAYADLMGAMILRDPASDRARHARAWLARTGAQPNWWVRAALAGAGGAGDASDLPLDYFAAGYKFLYARSDRGAAATSTLLELGALGAQLRGGLEHDGRESGSFQIWRNGRWLSRESVGYRGSNYVRGWNNGAATSAEHPVAHNTVLFQGNGQIGAFHAQPTMLRLQSAPAFTYAAVDLRSSYRSHATTVPANQCWLARDDWPFADRIVREFLLLRQWSVLLVIDRLRAADDSQQPVYAAPCVPVGYTPAAATAVQKTFLLHYPSAPTVNGRRVTATSGDQAIDAHLLLPAASTPRIVDERSCGGCADGQFRLEIDDAGAAETFFMHAIHTRDASAPPLTAALTTSGGTWTVLLTRADGQRATLRFPIGLDVGPASVQFGDGPVEALHDGVQGMQVLPQGPVWEASWTRLFGNGFETQP